MFSLRCFFPRMLWGVLCLALATGPLWAGARRPPFPHTSIIAIVDGKIRTGFQLVTVQEVPCLSLRDVQRLFGGRQTWHRVSREVTYEISGRKAEFSLDQSTVTLADKSVSLPAPVRWWTGQTYVPLSLILTPEFQEFAEATVQWDMDRQTMYVDPAPGVSSPHVYSYPQKCRVVVELGPRVQHHVLGQREGKVSIRFSGGRAREREYLEIQDGVIRSVELWPKVRSSELILQLAPSAEEPQISLQENPRRLVVEVNSPFPIGKESAPVEVSLPPAAVLPVPEKIPPAVPVMPEATRRPPAVPSSASPIRTIVIDPGHGGKDAGATGPHGTLEKDVNLDIARTLAAILQREGRFRVLLTRQDDSFLPLEERAEFANRNKADLFISIHCNAAFSNRSNGFEIYFLSEKATDEAAAAVARRENAVVEMEGLTGKTKQKLQQLLWSLARTETLNESSEIAGLIARQVERRIAIPNRGVKQAAFFVLRGATMPAVLVESGFITHPQEEGLLRSARFQTRLADALYSGVLDYEKRKAQSRTPRIAEGGN